MITQPTEPQKEAIGQVMADAFGANIQSGWANEFEGCAYVMWQFGPNLPVHMAHISPEGTVTYA